MYDPHVPHRMDMGSIMRTWKVRTEKRERERVSE